MEPTQQQIYAAFKKLPEQVRTYIVSVEAANDIATLGKNKSLSEQQISKLAKQSGFFLMKIVPEAALAGNIEYELDIDTPVAETLAAYIKEVIKPKAEKILPLKGALESSRGGMLESNTSTARQVEAPPSKEEPIHTLDWDIEPAQKPEPTEVLMPIPPRKVPINRIPIEPIRPPQVQPPAEPLPAIIHEEREITLRKIVTENPILNKQLEVPIVTKAAIVDSKLQGTFSEPKKPAEVIPPAPKPLQADPYREPIE